MEIYLKAAGGILIAVIFSVVLEKYGKESAVLLMIAVSCIVLTAAMSYLQPILEFAERLVSVGNLDNELLEILLKVVGIGMVSQIACLICADAGNQSLGKALQVLTIMVILCISVPILEQMLTLIETILGEI